MGRFLLSAGEREVGPTGRIPRYLHTGGREGVRIPGEGYQHSGDGGYLHSGGGEGQHSGGNLVLIHVITTARIPQKILHREGGNYPLSFYQNIFEI